MSGKNWGEDNTQPDLLAHVEFLGLLFCMAILAVGVAIALLGGSAQAQDRHVAADVCYMDRTWTEVTVGEAANDRVGLGR